MTADNTAENGAMLLYRDLEIDTLARTIWGEARGEGEPGMAAVANVVINRLAIARARGGMWWGDTMIGICQRAFQFSCWNKDDPNFRLASSITGHDLAFATAQRIARRACCGTPRDLTNGATHYHVAGLHPYWIGSAKPVAVIGHHVFYRIL